MTSLAPPPLRVVSPEETAAKNGSEARLLAAAATSGADALLLFRADVLEDIESTRIRTENRQRSLTDPEHGKGLSVLLPEVARQAELVADLRELEKRCVRELEAAMRRHPLADWVKRTPGIGLKQGARFLAVIGDPYWHPVHDRPRRVYELNAYCGMHTVPLRPSAGDDGPREAPKHRRGQTSNWNGAARMRLYLIAESCIKRTGAIGARSPFRDVYEAGREKYADAVHPKTGEPLTLGHQHARAMRLVMKAILKDVWRAAREIHLAGEYLDEATG